MSGESDTAAMPDVPQAAPEQGEALCKIDKNNRTPRRAREDLYFNNVAK